MNLIPTLFQSKHFLASIIVAFFATMVLIKLMIPLAIRIKLVDLPGGRKMHARATPLIGGIGMFLGFGLSILFIDFSLQNLRMFLVGAFLLVFTGVLDDFSELTPKFRLFVQIVTAMIMVIVGKVSLHTLGNFLFGYTINLDFTSGLIISTCAVVGIINAMNMLDGVDGLLGTIALIQFAMLAELAYAAGLYLAFNILVILVFCLLAYLVYNFPLRKNALVFMGDAGSMFLGFVLVWFCIYLSQMPEHAAEPVAFLWVVAIPILDIGSSIVRRLLRKKSPLKPDRQHIHHMLQALGLSDLRIVILLGSAAFLFGCVGLVAEKLNIASTYSFIAFVIVFLIYITFVEFAWRKIQKHAE